MDFSLEKEDEIRMMGLHFEEFSYVIGMGNLYSLYRHGDITKEKCIKYKHKLLLDYKKIHTELYFCRIEYDAWLNSTKALNSNYNTLVDLIKKKSLSLLFCAVNIIDILSGHHIYKRLYMAVRSKITQNDIEQMIDKCDILPERIDKQTAKAIFYMWLGQINEDGTLHTFKSLSDEELERISKILPEKDVYTAIPKECIPQ